MANVNSRDKQPFLEGYVYDLGGQTFRCVEACDDQFTFRPYVGRTVSLAEIDPRPLSKTSKLRADVDFRRGFWWGVNCVCDLTEKFGPLKWNLLARLTDLAATMRHSRDTFPQYSDDFMTSGGEILQQAGKRRLKK